jgi:hypothetical protein
LVKSAFLHAVRYKSDGGKGEKGGKERREKEKTHVDVENRIPYYESVCLKQLLVLLELFVSVAKSMINLN